VTKSKAIKEAEVRAEEALQAVVNARAEWIKAKERVKVLEQVVKDRECFFVNIQIELKDLQTQALKEQPK
jgi:hypothetical protein